jgi:hypothetical protein
MSIIQVNPVEAFIDKSGLLAKYCKNDPRIPRLSTIQYKTKEPTNGATIMGNNEKKITNPFRCRCKELTD